MIEFLLGDEQVVRAQIVRLGGSRRQPSYPRDVTLHQQVGRMQKRLLYLLDKSRLEWWRAVEITLGDIHTSERIRFCSQSFTTKIAG